MGLNSQNNRIIIPIDFDTLIQLYIIRVLGKWSDRVLSIKFTTIFKKRYKGAKAAASNPDECYIIDYIINLRPKSPSPHNLGSQIQMNNYPKL